jgi:hypothetical protein
MFWWTILSLQVGVLVVLVASVLTAVAAGLEGIEPQQTFQ